jgi:hypothetical protein
VAVARGTVERLVPVDGLKGVSRGGSKRATIIGKGGQLLRLPW